MKPVLELVNLKKNYNQGDNTLNVLKGINFKLHPGQLVALVGSSGAGKSTLLQITGLLDTPSSGNVIINDQDCANATETQRTKWRQESLGFVYQFHNLLPEFTALENVAMPMLVAGKTFFEAKSRAKFLLESMGLNHRLEHRPSKMSGGEQQRVAIVRALANTPKILLADEPTGNLDQDTAEQVFQELVTIARKTNLGAIVATHNIDLAKRMDRIIKIDHGLLIEV